MYSLKITQLARHGKMLMVGDEVSIKVIAIVRPYKTWSAYWGNTVKTKDVIISEGHTLAKSVAEDLFPLFARAELSYKR